MKPVKKSFLDIFAERLTANFAFQEERRRERARRETSREADDDAERDEWSLNAQIAGEELPEDWRYDEEGYWKEFWSDPFYDDEDDYGTEEE